MDASRRSIIKGAVWTAPAVVVASVAPAYASSAPVCIPAKVKSIKVYTQDKKGKTYYKVDVSILNKKENPEYIVTLNGKTIGSEWVELKKVKGNPEVLVISCGKVVWKGKYGRDC